MSEQLELFPVLLSPCPCGWVHECVYWCGPGHTNGKCPPWPRRLRDAPAAGKPEETL